MSKAVAVQAGVQAQASLGAALERVLIGGDLSKLTEAERVSFYTRVCASSGLNPLTRPFEYIMLNGKLVLYARKDATDQLRKIHGISVQITSRVSESGMYSVTARARTADGREDESLGAVSIAAAKGDALANAMMKAETKAKRRVTLSICGLGMLDETELETIPTISHLPAGSLPEVSKASEGQLSAVPTQLQEAPSDDPGAYVIPIGRKYKGKTLREVPAGELVGFINWLHRQASEKNEPLTGAALEFVEAAETFVAQAMEEEAL